MDKLRRRFEPVFAAALLFAGLAFALWRCYLITQSGLNSKVRPSATITAPLTSFNNRPPRSCSLRRPSVTTAMASMMLSSRMYAAM